MALYRHEFCICPWCGEQSGCRVDHLYGDRLPTKAGPWYCGECRQPFDVRVKAPGDVELTKTTMLGEFSRAMNLLRFDGKDGPVFFVMDKDRYREGDQSPTEFQDSQRFFFEEHSCPTNWLRDCVAVIEDGDCDPHGFLTFVRAVDVPQDFDVDDDEQWAILFPEAFGGAIIDGEARAVHLIGKPE